VLLKSDLDVQHTHNWGRTKLMLSSSFRCDQISKWQRFEFGLTLVCYLSPTELAQLSVIKVISVTSMNSVTPKAGANHELLFNNPAQDSFNSKRW